MNNFNRRKKTIAKREVDSLTQDVNSWWGKTFAFIKKTKVKTWKGVFALAFSAGIIIATVWMIALDIENSSDAAEGGSLTLMASEKNIILTENSGKFSVDALLNTNGVNVVATKLIITFNPENFELESWSTTNSVFAAGNICNHEGKPCEIVSSDPQNGKILITLAKPSPGVNTDAGIIARLNFKALKTTAPTGPNIIIGYSSHGDYDDSDVIADDGAGTDILKNVQGVGISVYSSICQSFTYSDWGPCQDGKKKRTVVSSLPAGCFGGDPVLTEDCNVEPGEPCESWQYTEWGSCQVNGKQYREVLSRIPEGCVIDEEKLEVVRDCVYDPPPCTSITYSAWGACQANKKQTRTIESKTPEGCKEGDVILERDCPPNSCTSIIYSDWEPCQSNNKQYRKVISKEPEGCDAGSLKLEQDCVYKKEKKDGKNSDADFTKEKKKDDEDPKFTNLPRFMTKARGSVLWWEAKDNEEISHFTYSFQNKKEKTKMSAFIIPSNAARGLHLVRITAFDKEGNSKARLVTVYVK